jgi:molecular chaperone DnaK
MRVLGIDFGTSNTAGMLRLPDGRLRPLLFDGSPLLPSAVYLGADGRMLVGRDAERHARLDPSRFEPNPKRRVDDGHIFLGDREMPVAEVFGLVLAQVATEARRQLNAAPQEVRLTHPARWGEQRRKTLVEAAQRAGLGNPRLIPEPVGAASYFTAVYGAQVPVGRSLAIYDLGGGTFDATVVRRTQSGFDVLAEEGLQDVGGLDFDHAVVEHLGLTYRASHGAEWERLVSPADANDRRSRRMLYEDVRGAKEMLSRTTNADIHLPALEVDAHLTREEFEALVRPYLDRTIACLQRAIAAARTQPQELVGIFLVGGSSRIPLAAHLIHTSLGVAPTTLEQPETVVVEGALCIGAARPPVSPTSGMPRTVSAPPAQQPPGPRHAGPVPPGGQVPPGGVRPGPAGPMQQGPARPMGQPVGANPVAQHRQAGPVAPGSPMGVGPGGHPVSSPPAPNMPVSTPPAGAMGHPRPPAGPHPPVSLHRPGYGPGRPAGPPPPPPNRAMPPPNRAMPPAGQPVRQVPPPQVRQPPPRVVAPPPQVRQPPPRAVPPPPQVRQAPPQVRPAPPRPQPQRSWYTEPTILGTIGILAVVAILFVVLIIVAV